MSILNSLLSNRDTDPAGTFDYIWIKAKGLEVNKCHLFGQEGDPNDATVYPSDHIGVLADITVTL